MGKKMRQCLCGGDVEICKKTIGAGMDGCYQNWEVSCKKCGGSWQWPADEFYGRDYYSKDEVIDLWNKRKENETSELLNTYRKGEKRMDKKLFVSVPMAGRDGKDIFKDILEAEKDYREMTGDDSEIEWVTNIECKPTEDGGPLYCLGNAIIKMGKCDGVVMAHGWRNARGCCGERYIADRYGMPIFYLRDEE